MEPAGLAVRCSVHEVPFQPAAMVRWPVFHTAVQAVAVGHDTPANSAGSLVVDTSVIVPHGNVLKT